jgi:hypothetical protein
MILVACSQTPGNQGTGYRGIPWDANAQTVAKKLGVAPKLTHVDTLFASYYQASAPKLGALMEKAFAKNNGTGPNGLAALKDMTMLNQGKDGYSLFFHGKFGMHVHPIPASEYDVEHARLKRRYGVIDKKVVYIPDEYNSAYFAMWHDADGKILLAKETYQAGPDREVSAAQIIHINKRVFDTISSELSLQK